MSTKEEKAQGRHLRTATECFRIVIKAYDLSIFHFSSSYRHLALRMYVIFHIREQSTKTWRCRHENSRRCSRASQHWGHITNNE